MAGSYNRVILMGNMTRDPELRTTPSGTQVAGFGLAVNERFMNKQTNQWEERANFIDCVAFGKTAESISRFFGKGRPIMLEGKLSYRQWEDKNTGAKRSKVEVVVDTWNFCDSGPSQGNGGGQRQASDNNNQNQSYAAAQDNFDMPGDDDIPF